MHPKTFAKDMLVKFTDPAESPTYMRVDQPTTIIEGYEDTFALVTALDGSGDRFTIHVDSVDLVELTYSPLYGLPQYSPEVVVRMLREQGCLSPEGRVMRYPEWFGAAEMFTAQAAGYLASKGYGPATYAHSDLFVVEK